jgi:hypothetical protein
MTSSPISVQSAADILAYIPHALGFAPEESFVLLTMHGKRLGATLRIDALQHSNPAEFAKTIVGYLSNDPAADGALFILYSNQPTIDGEKPYTAHAQALDTAMHIAGMPIRDSWLVTNEHWMTYFCDDAECCTAHPLTEITDSALNARMIFDGSNAERTTGADPVFTGDDTILERIADTVTGWAVSDPTDWTTPVMAENRALWQETTGSTPDEDTALQLIAALHAPAVRDRIIADTINTDDDLEEFARTFIGQYTGRPDWNRVDAIEQLVTDLLTYTPNEARAPLFSFLGWISWYKGRATIASQYLAKAREADPGHKLAQLLNQLVHTGTLTECTKNEHAAYRR